MIKRIALSLLITAALFAADKTPAPTLLEMAAKNPNSPQFREAALATLGDADVKKSTAMSGEGPDFLWLIESSAKPSLFVDGEPRPVMKQIKGTVLEIEPRTLAPRTSPNIQHLLHRTQLG